MKPNKQTRWAYFLLITAFLVLTLGGTWFYGRQKQIARDRVEDNLKAIAQLKADQITEWREDQLDDAYFLMGNRFVLQNVEQFFAEHSNDSAKSLLRYLRRFARQNRFDDILLVNTQGKQLLSVSGTIGFHDVYLTELPAAIRQHKPLFVRLHIEKKDPAPHISEVAPLFTGQQQDQKPLGALVLVTDASRFLYPLIQSWPTPSKTAETLLVRRDGNDVLFLNDLRFWPHAALKLRIPLTKTAVPAVMAILGKRGLVEGEDYRGVPVLADILPIPGSPWFMIAEENTSEVFAAWRFQSFLLLALFLGLMVSIGTAGLMFWQQEKRAHFQALYVSEAALRQTMERHHITLKSIGDAVIVTDAQGVVQLFNPVAEALTGWTENEARGKALREVFSIVNEETGEPVENPVAQVICDNTVCGLANHTLLISKNGIRRPIADSAAPIRDQNGQISGVVLVFRDQTEQRMTMRMTQIRLAMVEYSAGHTPHELMTYALDQIGDLMDSPIGFFHFVEADQKTISLQQWSSRTLAQFCRAEGKGLHYPIEQAGVWADSVRLKQPVIHNDFAALENKKGMPKGHAEIVRELVVPVMRRGQVVAILGVGNKPVDYTDKDVETISFLSDVTWALVSRKIMEEDEKDAEKRYRRLFESTRDGMLILDADTGTIIDVNQSLVQLLGLSREAYVGTVPWEIGPLKPLAASKEAFTEIKAREHVRYDDRVLKRTDGKTLSVELTSTVYTVEHSGIIEWAIRDITDKLWMETQLRQAQKMESVGRLAGGVAHDYNNMLGVILGYADLAMEKVAPSEALHEDLKAISNAANRSAAITRQLLAFARKQIIEPKVLDINRCVENTLKMLRRLIGEDIDIAWVPGLDLWPLKIDPSQLEQILANLCVNARDAISGVGKVTIETQNVILDQDYCENHVGFSQGEFVLLAVSDDGCGMDKETMDQIFEPFFTTKEMGRGTGLGLATVFGIVKQNKGFINVYSEVDKGTTFKIYLPRHFGEIEPAARRTSTAVPEGHGEMVLLVEDDSSIRAMSRMMLERLGYRALPAETPTTALRLAAQHQSEIVLLITDVVMPEMNGRDLANQIQSFCPGIKTLFMSGYTANVIAHRGVLDDGVQFIQKPFSKTKLAEAIKKALDQ